MKRLFKLVVFGALVAFAVKMLMAKKREWQGLTEPEVRSKLDEKLGARVPEEKLTDIKDKVVEGMRSAGVLREEEAVAEEAVAEEAVAEEAVAEEAVVEEAVAEVTAEVSEAEEATDEPQESTG